MTTRLAALTVLALGTLAHAQEQGGGPGLVDRGDTRWAVYTACTLVFISIIAYLLTTHKRLRAATEDLAHVERRVEALSD